MAITRSASSSGKSTGWGQLQHPPQLPVPYDQGQMHGERGDETTCEVMCRPRPQDRPYAAAGGSPFDHSSVAHRSSRSVLLLIPTCIIALLTTLTLSAWWPMITRPTRF